MDFNSATSAVDEEKKQLVGAILVPDKKIPRLDKETNEEYDVFFTKETIKQAKNPYGDGKAAEIILVNIKRYLQSENLIHKRFNDLNVTSSDSLPVGS